jgi:hypothetical protein
MSILVRFIPAVQRLSIPLGWFGVGLGIWEVSSNDSDTGEFAWKIVSCLRKSKSNKDRSFCIIGNRIGDSRYIGIFALFSGYLVSLNLTF